MILGLVFAPVVAAFQQGGSAAPQAAMQQRAHDEYEQHKQATIRINELAGEFTRNPAPAPSCLQSQVSS